MVVVSAVVVPTAVIAVVVIRAVASVGPLDAQWAK